MDSTLTPNLFKHLDATALCPDEESFEQHLNEHHKDSTPAVRKAISRSSRIPKRRPPHVCPLCGFDVSTSGVIEQDVQAPPQGPNNNGEPLLLKKLARHVAGHLRRLAFDSTRNLDRNDVDESNEAIVETFFGK